MIITASAPITVNVANKFLPGGNLIIFFMSTAFCLLRCFNAR
jgi:hypothetical protein